MPTLHELNLLTPTEAKNFFLTCCGSSRWAQNMAGCRPFWNVQVVHNAAETIWQFLTPEDQREALRARTTWTEESMSETLIEELNLYERKFGYRFVGDPQESNLEEIHSAVRRRLGYNIDAEFEIAVVAEAGNMKRELVKRVSG